MIYPLIIITISFLLDGLISSYINIFSSNISIFSTIYTVLALSMVTKYIKDEKKYYLVYLLTGLLFDMAYTNTFILNMTIFFLLGLITKHLLYILTDNLINNILISYINIVVYYITTQLILVISNYTTFNSYLLLKIIYSSIIMSIIYTIILYISNSLFKQNNFKHYHKKL